MSSHLVSRLHQMGVLGTQGVEEVASNVSEALELLGREPDGQVQANLKAWKEYFGEREQRLYYCNDEIGYNSWDAPPYFRFKEWHLDSQLYGIPLRLARDIYETLDSFLTRHPPEVVYKALDVLARMVGNVADCNNEVERYRSVKVDNPKFAAAVWDVPGATQVLFLVGFNRQGQQCSIGADVPLGPIQAAAARLRRLADKKGHSGEAISVKADDTDGNSNRPASPFYNTPGFRYQEQIWHCKVCDHPINDGSERLWTGRHDAPHGEFRYLCTTCEDAGTVFNLCQACWDRFQEQMQHASSVGSSSNTANIAEGNIGSSSSSSIRGPDGPPLHDLRHSFQHVGPRMTRHNDYYGSRGDRESSDPSNPWGRSMNGGASLQRALRRLADRHGIREWL